MEPARPKIKCDGCGVEFTSDWTDEEAQKEYGDVFGQPYERDATRTVCDDCYEAIMKANAAGEA